MKKSIKIVAPVNSLRHVAIIMDGNHRWASEMGLCGIEGHKMGVERVRDVLDAAEKYNISTLTLFGFSSENWKRPKTEVKALFSLLALYLKKELKHLKEKGVKLKVIGCREHFSSKLIKLIEDAEAATENGKRTLILALDYGGKWEIIEAARRIAQHVESGQLHPDEITEDTMNENMCLSDLPPPDICIRTGGERRISNFLLWHMAYTELYFTDCHWPSFDGAAFDAAMLDYHQRQRRFGKREKVLSDAEINRK
ncbi:MAG: undecaprenyl diphosphate synthase [Porticoccus sp.]|jgi:undecaprenyl diphosphate synthase